MRTWSLRTKLMTVIFGMSVISLGLFSLMAYKSTDALLEGKVNLTQASAKSMIDKIDRNLFERYGDVQAFALSEPARSGKSERITAFIHDMIPTYAPIYDLMIVVNNKGRVIATNTVDKTGKPIDVSDLIDKDYSGEGWFKEAIAGKIKPGTSFVEDLHVDEDVARILGNSGRVLNFTAPILDKKNGEILGVWSNRVSWVDVVDTITKEETKALITESMPKVFVYIGDKNDTYLLHPEGDSFELKSKMENFTALAEAGPITPIYRQINLKGFSGKVIEAIAPSKGYSTYPGIGWKLAIHVPEDDSQGRYNMVLIGIALIVLLLGSFVGYWVIRDIVRKLLSVNVQLSDDATNVKNTSGSIASASQNLAEASTEQASALQETAASIEQMHAMVKKSSENASRSRQVAMDSHDVATKGKAAVEQMVHAMEDINASNADIMRQIEDSNRQITEIIKVITEIGNKTKVINEIVFQTKLLSFNASVEAARAGEHGKGFAVVAEEVGSLAQMSGNAAKEISDMLNGSIQKVETIVNDTKVKVERLMAQGKSKTESGTVIARQCGQILAEVVDNVGEVNVMVSEISTAMQEQAQGISEINKAMNQLDQVTHVNATTSQQSANSSSQLSNQAESLFKAVLMLKETILGNNSKESNNHRGDPVVISHEGNSKHSELHQQNLVKIKHSPESPRERSQSGNLKRASGGDYIPSENDPRFKDI
jgi:methyl-accepting chemotaxis protein